MPTITDWLMVVITFVYVVATIFICIANLNSAKATRAQLAEMKHEHDENVRMSVMPYFEVNCDEFDPQIHKLFSRPFNIPFRIVWSFTPNILIQKVGESNMKMAHSCLNLKNVGMNFATSICVRLEYENWKTEKKELTGLTIRPGEAYSLLIASFIPLSELNDNNFEHFADGEMRKRRRAKIIVEFDDIRNNHYSQTAHISFTLASAGEFPYIVCTTTESTKADAATKSIRCYIQVEGCFTESPVFVEKTSEVQHA